MIEPQCIPLVAPSPPGVKPSIAIGPNETKRLGAEFFRYFIASGLALTIDFGLYTGGISLLGWPYPVSAAAGFLAGLATAYVLSVRWVFSVRKINDPRREFVIFAGVGVAGLGLTEGVLFGLISGMHLNYLLAKILSAALVFLFNFLIRKLFLFSHPVAKSTDGGHR
jgi:putative flippase GtrA